VHRARLANGGGEVAVKVVRHSIVRGLERVLRLINLVLSPTRSRTLKERTQRIYALVLCQTDMMLEAASINAMQRACDAALRSGVDSVRVPRIPRVHSITTCRSVLTMELVQGLLPFDRWRDAGVPGDLLAMRLAHYFLRSLLIDGIFHCDLHPGNIMIDTVEHGRFTLLDFGLVGELDETDRVNLCAFFLAALTGENAVAVDVFTKAFVTNADAVLNTHELRARFASEAEPCFAAHFVTADEFDVHGVMRDFESLFSRYKLLYTGVWAVVELGMLTLQGTLALLVGPAQRGGVKERMRQFVTANYKVMLRSLAGTPYFERLNDRVLAKFNWGAILARSWPSSAAAPFSPER
jgi:predicted unusual protein kinase regulating ubiquinone biosynthesis (AarF/ABC1/UbiB family)